MTEILKPQNDAQLLEVIKWAISDNVTLSVQGLGSKNKLGRLVEYDYILDTSALSGICMYEPGELVITAAAGTPLADLEKVIDAEHQELSFEPANYAKLLGEDVANKGTIGGMIASNTAGPRRVKVGAARDHFLGFKAVSGRGEEFKSGGRVVKNVTGYDLSKLMAGSWGTLGVMNEVTLKVMPKPEKTRTVLLIGADPEQACKAMTQAFGSSNEISAASWITEKMASLSNVEILKLTKGSVTAVRVEGPAPSVAYRCKSLRDMLHEFGQVEELHTHNSDTFWHEIRDVHPFASEGDNRVVWRISCAPQSGWKIINDLKDLKGVEAYMDWAGGLIWMAVDAPKVGAEGLIRDVVNLYGGHATLVRGSDQLRKSIPVFHPPQSGVMGLSKRLKENFDPQAILNPGRMYKGV